MNKKSYLFENGSIPDTLKEKIKSSEKVCLFLDYDGTLSHIRKDPLKARLGKKNKALLKKISSNSKIVLTIVSGRNIKDLTEVSGIDFLDNINLSGTHGAELLLKNIFSFQDNSSIFKTLQPLKKEIMPLVLSWPCLKLEDKEISFAIHYRNCRQKNPAVIDEIIKIINSHNKNKLLKILMMKKVIEVMPENIDKGMIIEKILKKECPGKNYIVICIGDDLTDENLFIKNPEGINIKVSKKITKNTIAPFFLKNTSEVFGFLKIIEKIK